MTQAPQFLTRPGKPAIAYRQIASDGQAAKPGLIWLGGYASDMLGTKATFLEGVAQKLGCGFIRFDYSGHGESAGQFEEGCISSWAEDALAVLDGLTSGPQILIGSSMGGWITCLLARQRMARLAGAVFIAPAPDFTEELMWPEWDDATRQTVLRDGKVTFPSDYDDSVMVYTKKLYEDGKDNLIFKSPLKIDVPIRILQGMQDVSVPWQHAMRLAEHIDHEDIQIHLSKKGDHRLSSEEDLKTLEKTIRELIV